MVSEVETIDPLTSASALDSTTGTTMDESTKKNNEALATPESREKDETNDDNTRTAKEFLLRLPPMERAELQTIVNAFSKAICEANHSTHLLEMESSENVPLEGAFWKEYDIRACRLLCDEKEKQNKGSVVQSMYPEELQHLHEQMTTYQTSYYKHKDGVTARFAATEVLLPCDAESECSVAAPTTESDVPFDVAKTEKEKPGLLLNTYVEHLDAANGNAGYWQGTWHIRIHSETQADVAGLLQLHTHAAERGSPNQIQSQARRIYKATVSTQEEKVNSIVAQFEKSTLSYAEKLMTKVVQFITAQEAQLYQDLDQWFQEPLEDGLRKLRRILPITKTRFKWDSSAQRNVQLLNARKAPANNA